MTGAATTLESIRKSLVGLRMPRALEMLDATLRRIEQGEINSIEALDLLLLLAILWWPRPCWIGFCIMRWSSRSRAQATGCGSTPN